MSRFVVLAILVAVVSSETCIPLSRLPECANVPLSVSQKDYDMVQKLFDFSKKIVTNDCPAFASQFYARQSLSSFTCAGTNFDMATLKKCNPGKPLAVCKRTCEKAVKERDEIAVSVKCKNGKPQDKSDANTCISYTDVNCFDLDIPSTKTPDVKLDVPNTPNTVNSTSTDTKKGTDARNTGSLLAAGMLAFLPICFF